MSTPEYKRILQEHLVQVEGELADRRRAAAPSGERPGFGKRAGDYVAQVVEDRTNNQLADSLEATANAIRRGLCQSCGAAISEDRLQAGPWAPLCMRCQSVGEQADRSLRRRPR